MARFTLPRDIYFGKGAIDDLKFLEGYKRAIIVTGGHSMQKFGFLDRVDKALRDAGIETKIFDGVEPDPSVQTVYRGAKAMEEFQPDIIVAIGGGSPIDAAKAMWVFYEYPDKKFDDIKDPFTMPKLRQKAIFVAIPSTSGTASEVTAFSVITDYDTKIKYPLADFEITPDVAILDSEIPMTMPESLTADTGMDAMTHAIEAYVAGLHSEFSDALALRAIQLIYENILASFKGDEAARGQMHIAQCMAGMSFSNALLGICHSLAHKVGAQLHIPHGRCNAIMLPYVIEFNSYACLDRYADIARSLGLPGTTNRMLVNALIDTIKDLDTKLGIAHSYKEHGIAEADYLKVADFIAENAEKDPCTSSNPREITEEQMRKVLDCTYYGKDVTF